jgi:hypothetical protein
VKGHGVQWETAKTRNETPGYCVADKAREGSGNCFKPFTERDDMDM